MSIMATVNGFNISHQAIKKAVELAKKEQCAVKIVAIIKRQELNSYKRNTHLWRQVDGSIISGRDSKVTDETVLYKIHSEICSIIKQFDEDIDYEIEVIIGEPYKYIMQKAEDEEINLIVLSEKGLLNIKQFFKGAYARGMNPDAVCPVMVVQSDCFN